MIRELGAEVVESEDLCLLGVVLSSVIVEVAVPAPWVIAVRPTFSIC